MTQERKSPTKTADRILESATECFAKDGFERTNLRDIAKKVGIREPSIYRHFKNKEELYQQVLYKGLAPVAETLLNLSSSKAGPREMVEIPGKMLMLYAKNPYMAGLLQQAVSMSAEQFENQVLEQWLTKLLETGKKTLMDSDFAPIDEIDTSLRILNLYNLCIGYFTNASLLQRLCGRDPLDPEILQRQERILRVTSKAWILSS